MTTMPTIQLYGEGLFRLKPDKPREPSREVHTLQARWQTPTTKYFKNGDAPPDYPNMRIVTTSEECEIHGSGYVQDLDCEGILGDEEFIELEESENQTEEGWDEMTLRVFTRDPDALRWTKGQRLINDAGAVRAGYENMYIVSRSPRKHRARGYYEIDLTLKGLRGTKAYKRRINQASTSSNSKFPTGTLTILLGDKYSGYPPTDTGIDASLSGDGLNVEYVVSTLSLVDVWISVGAPPTDKAGAFWAPPSPPDVSVASLPGVGSKFFFPWGWVCDGVPSENLPGTNLWLVSAAFHYQVSTIPIP